MPKIISTRPQHQSQSDPLSSLPPRSTKSTRTVRRTSPKIPSKPPRPLVSITSDEAIDQLSSSGYQLPQPPAPGTWKPSREQKDQMKKIGMGATDEKKRAKRASKQEGKSPEAQEGTPRPANRFVIFRSSVMQHALEFDFVDDQGKKGVLDMPRWSQICSTYWKRLSSEQRGEWQKVADEVLKEHRAKYPTYKYRPAPSGQGKKKKAARTPKDSKTPQSHSSNSLSGHSMPSAGSEDFDSREPHMQIHNNAPALFLGMSSSMTADGNEPPPLILPEDLLPQDFTPFLWDTASMMDGHEAEVSWGQVDVGLSISFDHSTYDTHSGLNDVLGGGGIEPYGSWIGSHYAAY